VPSPLKARPGCSFSLFAGVLGVLAYSTAIYMLIVLVLFCVAKLLRPKLSGPASRPLLLGTLAAALLVLGLGLAFRNAPQAKPDFAFDLPKLVEFVLIYLGNAGPQAPCVLLPAS
jgi:NADH:ubiquinone oxidoreductase subunit 6 (subunit J)